jgi:3-methyladenine DNA glycosylase/8-oxoguanine DNA glycosylase
MLLDDIKVTRGLLRQANKSLKTLPELDRELRDVIELCHRDIKSRTDDLVALERFRMAEGLEKDEAWKSESQRRREREWTEEQWSEYHESMFDLDKQLAELETHFWDLEVEKGTGETFNGKKRLADRQTTQP